MVKLEVLLASEPTGCKPNDHDFRKFDPATLFCRKCGEQRSRVPATAHASLEALMKQLNALPHYLPCPGPHYPYWIYPTVVYPVGGTTTYVPHPSWSWTISSSDVTSSIGSGPIVNG